MFYIFAEISIKKEESMKIEEAKKRRCACIYKLTFPDGKGYVGQTKDLGNRIRLYGSPILKQGNPTKVQDAISQYGMDNVHVSILREVRGFEGDDLSVVLAVLEIKYIRQEGTIWPDGYNVSIGGEILGIPADVMNTNGVVNQGTVARQILVYGPDGRFLKEYPSISRCSYDLGIDEDDLRGLIGKKSVYHGKYIFREKQYGYIPEQIEVSEFKVVQRVKYETVVEKRYVTREINVGQQVGAIVYDMNGDFCGEFPSKTKAAKSFTQAKLDWGRYANGYVIYKKPDGDYPKKIEPYVETVGHILGDYYKPMSECPLEQRNEEWEEKRKVYYGGRAKGPHGRLKNRFPIGQYTLDGELLVEYDSIRDASTETGINYSSIWLCIKGSAKSAGGYRWSRLDGKDEKIERYCGKKYLKKMRSQKDSAPEGDSLF